MSIHQREIVEVNFPLPDGTFEPHPAIILSNNDIIAEEEAFVCVMITSHNFNDEYTYRLKDEMLSRQLKKPCQVRCHLITIVQIKHIIGRYGMIKQNNFEEIIRQINSNLLRVNLR